MRFLLIALVLLVPSLESSAQGNSNELSSVQARDFTPDYVVPNSPAFSLVDVDQSTLLTPSSVRDLAATISDLVTIGQPFTIPKSYALEISPVLMFGGGPNLRTYAKSEWLQALYRLRLSAATRRVTGDTPVSQAAFGIRVSVFDKTDTRTRAAKRSTESDSPDDSELKTAVNLRRQISALEAKRIEEDTLDTAEWLDDTDKRNTHLLSMDAIESGISAKKDDFGRILTAEQDNMWNNPMFDIAFAYRLTGQDSTGRDMYGDKYRFWATIGTGVKSWGQFLFGTDIGAERVERTDPWIAAGSGVLKANIGQNALQIFLEGQLSFVTEQRAIWLLNSGANLRAFSGWWISAGIGLENPVGESDLGVRTNFALKFAVPKTFGT